jgi:hypothetical protein
VKVKLLGMLIWWVALVITIWLVGVSSHAAWILFKRGWDLL